MTRLSDLSAKVSSGHNTPSKFFHKKFSADKRTLSCRADFPSKKKGFRQAKTFAESPILLFITESVLWPLGLFFHKLRPPLQSRRLPNAVYIRTYSGFAIFALSLTSGVKWIFSALMSVLHTSSLVSFPLPLNVKRKIPKPSRRTL